MTQFFYENRQLMYLMLGIFAVCMIIKWLCLRGGDRLPFLNSYMFTGTMGAGKTYMSVQTATAIIRKRRRLAFVCRVLPFIALIWPQARIEPKIYSTYPIVRNYRKATKSELQVMKAARRASKLEARKLTLKERYELRCGGYSHPKIRKNIPVFYPPLKPGHLTGDIKVEEGSIFVIGEAGRFLPQWDFNNPVVCEQIAQLVALSRHFFNAVIIFDDQCSDNLVKAVRSRLGMIYHLHNFRRAWKIMPWYKVNYVPLLPVEDNNTTLETEGDTFFVGPLPYKWQKRKKLYESRCYRRLYWSKAVPTLDEFDGFETTYMMDISVNEALCKFYKTNKREYKRRFLYDDKWRYDVLSGEFVFADEEDPAEQSPADVPTEAPSEDLSAAQSCAAQV